MLEKATLNLNLFHMRLSGFWITAILFLIFSISCRQKTSDTQKIVYVNSYHRGHPSSDEIMDAILGSFSSDSFELVHYFMDTKRNPSHEYIKERASTIFDSILNLYPDILIVSDDNAVKHLVEPYLDQFDFPVVFCGVNTSADQYYLPGDRVTGILEILPISEVLQFMKNHDSALRNLLVLTENTTTSRKEKVLLDTMFMRIGYEVTHEMVNDFTAWKLAFQDANKQYDLIYIPTNGAIRGWNHQEAVLFVEEHIRIPVVTCEDFMMPYVVFGITKIAAEQGEWAANAAHQILSGVDPLEIPVGQNIQTGTWLNRKLAEKIGFLTDTTDICVI